MGGAETALLMPQTPSSLGEGGLRGYLARWVGERHGQDGSPLKLGLLVLKQQPPTPPKPLSPGSTPSLPGSARTAGQATRGWGSSAAAPLRAPAAQDREEPPPLGAPQGRGRPGPETYRAGGRPPAAAATAAAPPGLGAPWCAERALDAGGSRLHGGAAPGPARAQLHAPRGRSSREAQRRPRAVGSLARPRPAPAASRPRGRGEEGAEGGGRRRPAPGGAPRTCRPGRGRRHRAPPGDPSAGPLSGPRPTPTSGPGPRPRAPAASLERGVPAGTRRGARHAVG